MRGNRPRKQKPPKTVKENSKQKTTTHYNPEESDRNKNKTAKKASGETRTYNMKKHAPYANKNISRYRTKPKGFI